MTAKTHMLQQPLPDHWGTLQRLKNHLLYALIRFGAALLQAMPRRVSLAIAGGLGRLAFYVAHRDRQRALKHLGQAFPTASPAEHRRICRAMFLHLARCAADTFHADPWLQNDTLLDTDTRDTIAAALAEDKGVVAISGHIGHWELLGQAVAAAGFPASTIAKPLYDPRLTRWVHEARSRHGLDVLWRGIGSPQHALLRALKRKRLIAFLIDQDTKVPGVFAPFFGRPAHTPSTPARLALRLGCPVVLLWNHRQADGTYRFGAQRIPLPADNGDMDSRTLELTTTLNQHLERIIQEAPEQWVWMHRRWRQTPT